MLSASPKVRLNKVWGVFSFAIRMLGKAPLVSRVDWGLAGPGPAPKQASLVVLHGPLNLGSRVHDKGPILNDRLRDRATLEVEKFSVRAAVIDHLNFGARAQLHTARLREHVVANLYLGSFTETV